MATIRFFWQCRNCRKMVNNQESTYRCTHCGARRKQAA